MQGWKPECGFLHYGWEGYNEAIVLYVLALGSPTHPIDDDCYQAWTATYQWENLYGHDFLYGGPLFMHQFSHAWIDFRGIRDRFMREKDCDYFENSRRAVHVQREYAGINPRGHAGYDEDCWGLTACDGPSDEVPGVDAEPRSLFGYAARGVPYGPDDGTLSPPAVLASLPFAPELALDAIARRCSSAIRDRPRTRLRQQLQPRPGRRATAAPGYRDGLFGLDQGIIVLMMENHRSGMTLAADAGMPLVVDGLRRAGFGGGWLDAAAVLGGAILMRIAAIQAPDTRRDPRRTSANCRTTCARRDWRNPEPADAIRAGGRRRRLGRAGGGAGRGGVRRASRAGRARPARRRLPQLRLRAVEGADPHARAVCGDARRRALRCARAGRRSTSISPPSMARMRELRARLSRDDSPRMLQEAGVDVFLGQACFSARRPAGSGRRDRCVSTRP